MSPNTESAAIASGQAAGNGGRRRIDRLQNVMNEPSGLSASYGRAGSNTMALIATGLLLFGLFGAAHVLTRGHIVYNTGTEMMWGLLVANYAYWALASFGLSFIATLALGFGISVLDPVVKRCLVLAISTLIAAMISLWLELGQPFGTAAIPLNLQIHSPMFWMGLFYFTYLGLLAITLYRTVLPGGPGMSGRLLSIAHFVAALLSLITQGLMYGMMTMRPFWYSPVLPVYFLMGSFLLGVALITLFVNVSHGFDRDAMPESLRKLMGETMPLLFLVSLVIYIFGVTSRVLTGLWSNADGLQVFGHMVASPLFQIEVLLGLAVPLVLLAVPSLRRRPMVQAASALLVLMSLYIARYEFVIGGQVVPLFKGQSMPSFTAYTPSLTEWMVVALTVGVALFIYLVASLTFRLSEPHPKMR